MFHPKFSAGVKAVVVAVAAVTLAGCASVFTPKPPEEAVRERATARWQALVAGQYDKAYQMLSPSYRGVTSQERYTAGLGGAAVWTGAEVIRVNCEPEKCTARVRIDAKPLAGPRYDGIISTGVDEIWVNEGGQWWLYQAL